MLRPLLRTICDDALLFEFYLLKKNTLYCRQKLMLKNTGVQRDAKAHNVTSSVVTNVSIAPELDSMMK